MAFTVEQAKLMRAAYQKAGNRVVQIGHQTCSLGHVADASNYLASGTVGQVTAIRAHMYRNTPHGKPQWTRPVYPDMTPETIAWNAFLGSAPARDFDADRYINWRLFHDYSGGNVHENMSQQLAFWYKVMGLDIPHAVTMTGGIYRWQDGREVPDTMNVVMDMHETLLFSWDSGFGNNQLGVTEDVLGTDGTISRGQQIRYLPQKVNRPDGIEMLGPDPHAAARAHAEFPRLHPHRQADQLPVRYRLPRLHRVQHGDRELLRRTHRPLGPGQGRNRLNAQRARGSAGVFTGSGAPRGMAWAVRGRSSAVFGPSVWRGQAGPQSHRAHVRRRPQPRDPADPGYPRRLQRARHVLPVRRECRCALRELSRAVCDAGRTKSAITLIRTRISRCSVHRI